MFLYIHADSGKDIKKKVKTIEDIEGKFTYATAVFCDKYLCLKNNFYILMFILAVLVSTSSMKENIPFLKVIFALCY